MTGVILFTCCLNPRFPGLFQVPETKCDATQPTSPCSPVLGGSVSIKLMTTATGYILKCYKDVAAGQAVVFSFKRTATIEEPYQNRTEFIIDTGTFKISNVKKSDTGRYIVTVHNSDGEHEKDVTFILDVKGKCWPINPSFYPHNTFKRLYLSWNTAIIQSSYVSLFCTFSWKHKTWISVSFLFISKANITFSPYLY